jgi:hypothetical protein
MGGTWWTPLGWSRLESLKWWDERDSAQTASCSLSVTQSPWLPAAEGIQGAARSTRVTRGALTLIADRMLGENGAAGLQNLVGNSCRCSGLNSCRLVRWARYF